MNYLEISKYYVNKKGNTTGEMFNYNYTNDNSY